MKHSEDVRGFLGGVLLLDKKKAYWYLTLTVCAWGSLYVVSKVVLAQLPVVTTLFMRYLIAGVALFFKNTSYAKDSVL